MNIYSKANFMLPSESHLNAHGEKCIKYLSRLSGQNQIQDSKKTAVRRGR